MRLKFVKILILTLCVIGVPLTIRWSGTTEVIDEKHSVVSPGSKLSDALDDTTSTIMSDLVTEEKAVTVSSDKRSTYKTNKYLIYRCMIGDRCGGWADRLKGLITGYILSTLTNRQFRIAMNFADCDFLSVIQPNPNGPSWQLNISRTLLKDTKISHHNYMDNVGFYKSVKTLNFSKVFKKPIVYFRANLDYIDNLRANPFYTKQLTWMANLTRDQVYKKIFEKLFVLAPNSQKLLNDFLSNARPASESRLICAHIRTGRNPTLPKDMELRATKSDAQKVLKFLSQYNNSENHIFLTSDSEEVIAEGRKAFGTQMVENKGVIIHVDQMGGQRDQACSGFNKIIIDQQILIKCDTLLISFSGFSRLAAYIRGKDTETFCLLRNHTGIVPCKPSTMKELYHVMG